MITCPKCHKFVRVLKIEVWWLSGEVKQIIAQCKKHGLVAANYDDYDELGIEEGSPDGEIVEAQ